MTHSYMHHDSFIRATWRIHICTVTHSCLVLRQILFCAMTHSYTNLAQAPVCHDSLIPATWRFHICTIIHSCLVFLRILFCAMMHSYMHHDSFIYAPWLIHICTMPYSYLSNTRQEWVSVPWLIHICDITYSYLHGDTLKCSIPDWIFSAPWLTHISNMTHAYLRNDEFIRTYRSTRDNAKPMWVLTYSNIHKCVMPQVWIQGGEDS